MKITENIIRLLQRALNALGRETGASLLTVDGIPGRRTMAAFFRFLAARGCAGEAALVRAMRALFGARNHSADGTCELRELHL